MKLSVFTVATPDLTPEELVREAKAAGIDGVEWRYKEIPADARDEKPSYWRRNLCSVDPAASDDELRRFREITEAAGLVVLSLTPYLTAGDVASTEAVMRAARTLGAKFVRIGVHGYNRTRNYRELFEEQLRYMESVQDLARTYGVRALVETHHRTIAASASAAYRLVERFDPAYVGVLYDPGNMVHEGYENFRAGVELLGPYLAHVHVKNAGWRMRDAAASDDGPPVWESHWVAMDRGIVDWKQVVDDLRAVGYDGYLGVEDFSGTYGSAELLRAFAQWIRSL